MAIHPASNSEYEELQRMGHCERLLGRDAAADRPRTIHLASAAFSHLTGPVAATIVNDVVLSDVSPENDGSLK